MNIEVKAVNDILVMKINQEKDFEMILTELNMLLDQPIFIQDGYFPRAFFDLGSRQLENHEIEKLVMLLLEKKRVLFEGVSLPVCQNEVDIYRHTLRNGEEIHIYKETLFLGSVNPGSFVYCHDHVYFLNVVRGTIVILNEKAKVYGHDFKNANIYINFTTMHKLTTSAMTCIYYKDNQIKIEEDGYEQDNCSYIG